MPLYLERKLKTKTAAKDARNEDLLGMFSSSTKQGVLSVVRRPRTAPGAHPLTQTRVKVVETLTKAHQMEGDGLLLLLYYQLFKKTWNSRKEFQSCPGARCPDTVVYEHNFPQHWYTYDAKHGELLKRPGSYLDTAQINKFFSRPVSKECDIVAQYLCSQENTVTEEMETSVEFFTESSLYDFLHNRKTRPDGVLQRFVTPKGEHNFQIQAVWSPKVTLVYKRTNNYRMKDKTVGVYSRAVTCDGPPHFSREDLLAEKTREEVVKICNSFVSHFSSTEHKPVSRVVMYFKVDDKDNIWVMWASSLRIGTTKFSSSHQRIPLNLSTKFTTPDAEQRKKRENVEGIELERKLLAKDIEQYRLSSDVMFATTFCGELRDPSRPVTSRANVFSRSEGMYSIGTRDTSPTRMHTHALTTSSKQLLLMDKHRPYTGYRKRVHRKDSRFFVPSDRPPFLPSPRPNAIPPPWSPTNPFHKQLERLGLDGLEQPMQVQNGETTNVTIQEDSQTVQLQQGAGVAQVWWKATSRTEEDYNKLMKNEEAIKAWAYDLLYHIYSHTLNHGLKVLYTVKPPFDVWDMLCGGDFSNTRHADLLMSALGLKEYEAEENHPESRPKYFFAGYGCSARIQSEDVVLNPIVGTPSAMDRPMAQLSKDIDTAISNIFDELRNDLERWTLATRKQKLSELPPTNGDLISSAVDD